MPKRNDKNRKKRPTRSSSAGAQNAAGSASNATSTPNSRRSTPQSTGRNTNNSRGNRGRKPTKRTPTSKKVNGRGRWRGKRDGTQLQDPNCYKTGNGEIYRPGDFAFVDSQQADLPYHICVIRDFKMARKDSIMAEVKWFYRVSELPEAVYLLLMEDRMKGTNTELFEHPKVKEREIFMAYNVDTHPASLFRGKCQVKEISEVEDLPEFMAKDDSFFYCYGYKPESRRLTDVNEESLVPQSQQAVLPDCVGPDGNGVSLDGVSLDRYNCTEDKLDYPPSEQLVWKPHPSDDDLLMYLRAARSIALHAGVCMSGYIADGYLAASSDETTQHAFDVLHRSSHDTEKALQDLVKRPIVSRLIGKKKWTKESTVLFSKGMRQFGKNFYKIRKELLPNKEIKELTEYYYYWKKTNAGLSSRNSRKQRKQSHIRMSRAVIKAREPTPDKEFMDWSSCDEEQEGEGEEGEKPQRLYKEVQLCGSMAERAETCYYACRHCFTTASPNWHHAGAERTIHCHVCRVYFQRYGCMRPLTVKKEPPEFMFKVFHESLVPEEQNSGSGSGSASSVVPGGGGRKTRNSNGSRGGTRVGLRSGKNYSKSDTDEEEGEASDSSDSSSEEVPEIPVTKPKVLQTRRSILDNLDEKQTTKEELPAKRPKREEENEANESDEEGSTESTNGEGDQESNQKSPEGEKSPGEHSSSSSNGDDEGESPCSSRGSVNPASSNVPQQFSRVVKDTECTCARTDLVYIHPPAEDKIAVATKVITPLPLPLVGPSTSSQLSSEPGPSSSAGKVMITPHAPQLPMGPGPFMGFPLPYPLTPVAANPTPVVRSNSLDAAAAREQEQQQHMLLWHQQQQQWLQLQSMAQQQQKQLELHSQFHHMIPPPPNTSQHHPVGFMPPPPHSVDHSQQVAFTFPNPEEMAARQRMAAQMGLPEHFGGIIPAVMHPAAAFHPVILENMSHMARPEDHPSLPTPHLMSNMELLAQHHQQQALAAAAAGMSPLFPPSAENILEFQRQFEAMMQQVQKDPNLLQHPHVQLMLQQHQRLVAMQEQNAVIMHLRMQEMFVQQQHELQKQMALGRAHEDSLARNRPGVIVQPK